MTVCTICTGCASLQDRVVGWTSPSFSPTAVPAGPIGAPSEFESNFSVARAYEMQGKYNQAEEVYGRMVARNPENHRLHHRLGVLAVRKGDLDDANSHFDQALKGAPDDPELLADIGYTMYLQGRYAEAEQSLKDVVANYPDQQRAVNNLGMVLAKMGRGSEAYRVFRKTGSDAEAHSNLAYAYANTGQLDLAEKHYSRALDYDDTLTQASDALLQLDDLRRDLDAGAVLQTAAPINSQGAEDLKPEDAQTPQPMENPDSVEFASRWRQTEIGGQNRKSGANSFQFEDEFYDSASSRVTPAVHLAEQSDSASRGEVLQSSGTNSLNRN